MVSGVYCRGPVRRRHAHRCLDVAIDGLLVLSRLDGHGDESLSAPMCLVSSELEPVKDHERDRISETNVLVGISAPGRADV